MSFFFWRAAKRHEQHAQIARLEALLAESETRAEAYQQARSIAENHAAMLEQVLREYCSNANAGLQERIDAAILAHQTMARHTTLTVPADFLMLHFRNVEVYEQIRKTQWGTRITPDDVWGMCRYITEHIATPLARKLRGL